MSAPLLDAEQLALVVGLLRQHGTRLADDLRNRELAAHGREHYSREISLAGEAEIRLLALHQPI